MASRSPNLEVETLQHKKPTFHGDTIYAETKVLDKRESQSKPDRGVVTVETWGFNQRGEEVCYFRRRVMVPNARPAKPRLRPYESPAELERLLSTVRRGGSDGVSVMRSRAEEPL